MADINQQMESMFKAARIPRWAWDKRLEDIRGGIPFKEYVCNNQIYMQHRNDAVGVCIYGDAAIRADLFPVLARAFVLRADRVSCILLSTLVDMLDSNDSPLYDEIPSMQTLFLGHTSDHDLPFPYGAAARAHVEEFILERAHSGKRVCWSMDSKFQDNSWWSNDFKRDMARYVLDQEV